MKWSGFTSCALQEGVDTSSIAARPREPNKIVLGTNCLEVFMDLVLSFFHFEQLTGESTGSVVKPLIARAGLRANARRLDRW